MFGIISYVLLGLLAGTAAKYISPGPELDSWKATLGLGVGGAMVGGIIGKLIFGAGTTGVFSPYSIILAVGGASLLLYGYRKYLLGQGGGSDSDSYLDS